jgi:hypothetical protein
MTHPLSVFLVVNAKAEGRFKKVTWNLTQKSLILTRGLIVAFNLLPTKMKVSHGGASQTMGRFRCVLKP